MPLKREPEAVSALPLGTIEGETLVSKGCQAGSKPRPMLYSSAVRPSPPLRSPPAARIFPFGSNVVALREERRIANEAVLLHVPDAGSYSSALRVTSLLK